MCNINKVLRNRKTEEKLEFKEFELVEAMPFVNSK